MGYLAADVLYDDRVTNAFIDLCDFLVGYLRKEVYVSYEKRMYFNSASLTEEAYQIPYFLEMMENSDTIAVEHLALPDIPQYILGYTRSVYHGIFRLSHTSRCG